MSDYWQRQAIRAQRRAVLKGGVAFAVGTAGLALVGCGDDDSGGSVGPTPQGQTQPAGGSIKPGGTLQAHRILDLKVDPLPTTQVDGHVFAAHVYGRLVGLKTYTDPSKFQYETIPDLADSWEQPDEVTVTFKLNPSAKYHDKPPVNGRAVEATDVVESFKKFKAQVATNINSKVFDPVVDGEPVALDAHTIQFKTKGPQASFIYLCAAPVYFWLYPKELLDNDKARTDTPVGFGPWMFKAKQEGVAWDFDANPSYHRKDEAGRQLPYAKASRVNVIPEYQNRLSQLQAGNIDFADINPEDAATVASFGTVLKYGPATAGASGFPIQMRKGTYSKDPRIRRALSMLIDRDAFNHLFFKNDGRWVNPTGPAAPWYEDPATGKDSWAKYYLYNPAEAKKLLDAASFTEEIPVAYNANGYGEVHVQQAQFVIDAFRKAGLKVKDLPLDYRTQYIAAGGAYSGNYDGLLHAPTAFDGDPHTYLNNHFQSQSGRNISGVNDPEIDSLIQKLASTFKPEQRIQFAKDILRKNVDQVWYMGIGGGPLYRGLNKRVQNFKWMPDRSEPADSWIHAWLDDSKR